MLIRCLYVSRPAAAITSGLISSILAQAARNNPPLGVTGLLCFTADAFIQVLEGTRESVCQLLTSIVVDPRHRRLEILVYEEVDERRYAGWAMGELDLGQLDERLLLQHYGSASLDPYRSAGRATMALLEHLARLGLTP